MAATTDTAPVRIAVVGTGRIGSVHARLIAANPSTELVGLSGLDAAANDLANELGVPLFADYRRLLDLTPDGVVVATANHLHHEMGCFFAEHGVSLLVEKPIADTLEHGRLLCDTAARHDVVLLVGHHRRYNNLVLGGADMVQNDIGRLVTTNTMITFKKPDSYYRDAWQRSKGAGPLLINLIHEIDTLRVMCGEIDRVQVSGARLGRGFDFDDTAAIVLEFRNGALGTVVISDSTPSPWSWEASVDDGLGFHFAGQDYAHFLGTEAALAFPSLTRWSYDPADGEPGWLRPLHSQRTAVGRNNPYVAQIEHFAAAIAGLETPRVPGEDALRSLAVVAAVIEASETRGAVEIADHIG